MSASILTLWPAMLAVVAVPEFPAVLQRCVSDEVQAPWGRGASPQRHLSGQKMERRRATPQPIRIRGWISRESSSLSEAERRVVEAAVEEAVVRVSDLLSGEEHTCTHARMHALSLTLTVIFPTVDRVPGPLLLNRDARKYCKFVWKNSSSANYNRWLCTCAHTCTWHRSNFIRRICNSYFHKPQNNADYSLIGRV